MLESISNEDLYFALQKYGEKLADNKKDYSQVKAEEFERLQLLRPLPVLDERSLISEEVEEDYEIQLKASESIEHITLDSILPHEITSHIEGVFEKLNSNVNLDLVSEDEPIDYTKEEPPVAIIDEEEDEEIVDDEIIDDDVIEDDEIEDEELEDDELEDEDEEEIIEDDDEEELLDDDEDEEDLEEDFEEEEEEEFLEDEEDEEIIEEDEDDFEDEEELEEEEESYEPEPEPIIEEVKLVKPVITPPIVEKKEKVQAFEPVFKMDAPVIKKTEPVFKKDTPVVAPPKPELKKEEPVQSQFDVPNNPRPSRRANSNSLRMQSIEGSEEDFIKSIMNSQNSKVTPPSSNVNPSSPKVEEVKVENLPPDPISYLRLHPRSKENEVKKLYSPKVVDDYINSGIITRARGVLLI